MTTVSTGNVGTSAVQVAAFQWIFGPIAAVNLGGDITIRIRGRADIYIDLYEERCALYVLESDGSSVRGTLIPATQALRTPDVSEWTTAFVNYSNTILAASVTDVAAQDGDYIVIEVGADHDAAGANDGFDIEIGDTHATNHMLVTFAETITGGVAPTTLSYTYPTLIAPKDQPALTNTPTTDGIGNLAYAITAGSLPSGVTLDASTGVISGTPTASGTYNFTVEVSNSLGDADVDLTYRVGSSGSGVGYSMKINI